MTEVQHLRPGNLGRPSARDRHGALGNGATDDEAFAAVVQMFIADALAPPKIEP